MMLLFHLCNKKQNKVPQMAPFMKMFCRNYECFIMKYVGLASSQGSLFPPSLGVK